MPGGWENCLEITKSSGVEMENLTLIVTGTTGGILLQNSCCRNISLKNIAVFFCERVEFIGELYPIYFFGSEWIGNYTRGYFE